MRPAESLDNERLWSRIAVADCWEWLGATNGRGARYGCHGNWYVHRLVWTLLVGPVPAGLHLDHLCKNTVCCNPDHLEPVTPAENHRRGALSTLVRHRNLSRTHCKSGHKYTPQTVRTMNNGPGRTKRVCVPCRDRRRSVGQ